MKSNSGRKPVEINTTTANNLSMLGASITDISKILGVGYSTLRKRIDEDEELEDAIVQGRGQGLVLVLNELMKVIKSDKVTTHKMTAIKLYLQALAPETWNPDFKVNQPKESNAKGSPSADEVREFNSRYRNSPFKSVS